MEAAARTYRAIQAEIKALTEQADAFKQIMIREMDARQAESLTAGEYTIRWNCYEVSRLDIAKLKADHDDLYSAYTRNTIAIRFQVS
jgi:predicted phage-related endonuclease